MEDVKANFIKKLRDFSASLEDFVSYNGGDWSIKGFLDANKNIYTISSDTKIISKILEIQLFPKFLEFANKIGYEIILAEKQNWYPDITFVKKSDSSIKFAVDIKTTYRLEDYPEFCNGFTLGSHGEYFRNRNSKKNIQFPYGDYLAHISLGIIYTRTTPPFVRETKTYNIDDIHSIKSVIKNLLFFVQEKWKLSSDRSGSGNTANIGSIHYIPDMITGNGVFVNMGETIFDEYWINQGVLQVPNPKKIGEYKKLTKLSEYIEFKGMNLEDINPPKSKRKSKKT